MTKKLRVCFCIDSLKVGGAERLIVNLINNWPAKEFDLHLITFYPWNDFKHDLVVDKLKYFHAIGDCGRTYAISFMYNFCKRNDIDIVLTHLERANKWFGIGGRLAGAKVVSVVHSINLYNNSPFFKKIFVRNLYDFIPNRIVAVSDDVKGYLEEMGVSSSKISVIYNGIDVFKLRSKYYHITKFKGHNNLDLAVIGRLEAVKGIDLLLKALHLLNKETKNWSLKIIGDGSIRKDLEHMTNDLGLGENVCFLGLKKEPFKYLEGVKAIVITSHREGLPMVLLESLSVGMPAIVSNVGFLPKIIKDGFNGMVIPSLAPEDIFNVLKRFHCLSESEWRNMSENALHSAGNFDINQCVRSYQQLLTSLMQ